MREIGKAVMADPERGKPLQFLYLFIYCDSFLDAKLQIAGVFEEICCGRINKTVPNLSQ